MTLVELQEWAYNNLDNYKIIQSGGVKNTVAVYFTSHNLFYPDTVECFEKAIKEKDRYEWTRIKLNRASKHIFLRDIFKIWYVKGINSKINSIPQILDFLKKETEGYGEIVMIGSSAGGTAAALFGSMLNADIIFDFNGQFEMNSSILKDKIKPLEELKGIYGCYYNLVDIVTNAQNIYYFVSSNSYWDIQQWKHSRNMNLNRIYFSTSHHGIPFLKCALPKILNMNKRDLANLADRHFNPLLFTIRYAGLISTIKEIIKIIDIKFKKNFR